MDFRHVGEDMARKNDVGRSVFRLDILRGPGVEKIDECVDPCRDGDLRDVGRRFHAEDIRAAFLEIAQHRTVVAGDFHHAGVSPPAESPGERLRKVCGMPVD
ncbi:MAG: hypothetical protein H6Q83_1482 [Deltaproteobacteria bacterium]|nr:hypothetical protein [Deltaproteobacteria bacterium]